MTDYDKLRRLFDAYKARRAAMTKAERDAHDAENRRRWVIGELMLEPGMSREAAEKLVDSIETA